MKRLAFIALLVSLFTFSGLGTTWNSEPFPVEVKCPVCAERFVYIAIFPYSDMTVKTCPWCLFSSPTTYIEKVHREDVPAIRAVLESAADALPRLSEEIYGVDFATLAGEGRRLYVVENLLAMVCCGPRRDLPSESLELAEVVLGWSPTDSAQSRLKRRLWQLLERHKDEPIAPGAYDRYSAFESPSEQMAMRDRGQIERNERLVLMRVEHGAVEEGLALLKTVEAQVEAWKRAHGPRGIRWQGQVTSIPEDLKARIDRMLIHQWSAERLEEAVRQYQTDLGSSDLANADAVEALKEIKRRSQPAGRELLIEWSMQSPDHFAAAVRHGIIDHATIAGDDRLLRFTRQIAESLASGPLSGSAAPWYRKLNFQRLTAPYLDEALLRSHDSVEAILRTLEERSLNEALSAPLYQTRVVSPEDLAQESPFGFERSHLKGVIAGVESVADLSVGQEIVVPQVPSWYALERWPVKAMWQRLPILIEEGSETALATALRWLPTLTEDQMRYESDRGDCFGRLLTAIHNRPDQWPKVLAANVQPTGRLQETYLAATRACAGDRDAAAVLVRLVAEDPIAQVHCSIAIVALGIIEDRTPLPFLLGEIAEADWRVRSIICDYLGDVAGRDDLDSLRRVVTDIRRRPVPEDRRTAVERLRTLSDVESVIRDIRLRDLVASASN